MGVIFMALMKATVYSLLSHFLHIIRVFTQIPILDNNFHLSRPDEFVLVRVIVQTYGI